MKKLVALLALALAAAPAWAGSDPFENFGRDVDADGIKPFTRDLGLLMSSGINHTGRTLGLSGFDVGVHSTMIFAPRDGNTVLTKSGTGEVYLPVVQAEIGLPLDIDAFIRAFSWQGFTVSGGGLRWQFTKSGNTPGTYHGLVYISGQAGVHENFSATNFAGGVSFSRAGKKFEPFVTAGASRTRVVVKSATTHPEMVGDVTTAWDPVGSVGLNIRPVQNIYMSVAGNAVPSKIGMEGSLSLHF